MSLTGIFILVAAGLGAGTLFSRIFREGLEAREVIERVPPARIGEGKTGWVRIRGRVHALEEPLTTPWTGRTAVYCEVDVLAATIVPRNSLLVQRRRLLVQRRRHVTAVAFEIDDGSGRARVRLPAQLVDDGGGKPEILTSLKASKGFSLARLSRPPAEIRRLMPALKLTDPIAFLPVRAVERIIAPGDEVIIAGNATLEVDPSGASIGFRSPPTLMVFAATDDHALVLANASGPKAPWRA